MMSWIRRVCQVGGWALLLLIIALSVEPASLRPVTSFPHDLEHFAIFFAAGVAFAVGYPKKEFLQAFGLVAFAALIELAQMSVPGRHARLSDFVVDAAAAAIGVLAVALVSIGIRATLSWQTAAEGN